MFLSGRGRSACSCLPGRASTTCSGWVMVTGAAGAAWGTAGAVTGAAVGTGICGTVGGEGRVAVISTISVVFLNQVLRTHTPPMTRRWRRRRTTSQRTTVLLGASSSNSETRARYLLSLARSTVPSLALRTRASGRIVIGVFGRFHDDGFGGMVRRGGIGHSRRRERPVPAGRSR